MNRPYSFQLSHCSRVTRQRVSRSFSSFFNRAFCDFLSRCLQNFKTSAPSSVSARSKATISSSRAPNSARFNPRWTRSTSGRDTRRSERNRCVLLAAGRARIASTRTLELLVRWPAVGARQEPSRIEPFVQEIDALALARPKRSSGARVSRTRPGGLSRARMSAIEASRSPRPFATRSASGSGGRVPRTHPPRRQRTATAIAKTVGFDRTRQPTILNRLDMSRRADQTEYRTKLERLQGRLHALHRKAQRRGLSAILVFEGWDAAGKGGAIRRVTHALDARALRRHPDRRAPTEEERAQPICGGSGGISPRRGALAIFDRSWYGRVLVERVEGFCVGHRAGCARTARSTTSRSSSSRTASSS